MKTCSSMFVLVGLGVLPALAGAVDTSSWKCETCPFDKAATTVTVEAGVGGVSDDSARFGDYRGLQKKGAFAVLGGSLHYRSEDGRYASVEATDLGLDVRALSALYGKEGLYTLKLGYAETPRSGFDGARTPFLGVGGASLTLPAGYPAPTTTAMPLAATLQPVDVESKRSRLDIGAAWNVAPEWTTRLTVRHDVRDGLQRLAGSFFSSASQLLAPVDQVTDQLEASVSYVTARLQASVAYQASLFRNGPDALTWANPFTAVVAGSTSGQLALAPDNQFHQLRASGAYELTPQIRASGDIAVGRMTQDSAFLAATLNTGLAVGALPAQSLNGQADTFNASARVTATLNPQWRLNASYARDVRDNQTASLAFPAVSTDMFVGAVPRTSQPFSFTQDRYKFNAEFRGPFGIRASAGVDEDDRERTLQEVVTTRETTLWARAGMVVNENVTLTLKGAHGDRRSSTYGIASWVVPAENPLLRKFNLAERNRDSVGVRTDATVGDSVSVGLYADVARDDYDQSTIGLLSGRSVAVGGDVSAAVNDDTQLHLFAQNERIRSRQAGSQLFAQPDWWADTRDRVEVIGVGLKHNALKGKLELAADVVFSRARSNVVVDTTTLDPPFPSARTSMNSLRLQATYKLQENLTLLGSWWYESLSSQDWHIDGVAPDTVANLLALGDTAPRYRVNVLRVGVRYRY